MRLKLNAYPLPADLEKRIAAIVREAQAGRAKELEIAYGPSKVVKKRILAFLNKKEMRALYHRLEKTERGWGRVYLYFK